MCTSASLEPLLFVSPLQASTWRFLVFVVVLVPLSRLLLMPPLCALANIWQRPRISWRASAVLVCAGLRGAVSYDSRLKVAPTLFEDSALLAPHGVSGGSERPQAAAQQLRRLRGLPAGVS